MRPEDVIGLKAQAITNNPERKGKDESDILSLLQSNQGAIDWSRVEEYYRLFKMEEEFKKLKKRFQNA